MPRANAEANFSPGLAPASVVPNLIKASPGARLRACSTSSSSRARRAVCRSNRAARSASTTAPSSAATSPCRRVTTPDKFAILDASSGGVAAPAGTVAFSCSSSVLACSNCGLKRDTYFGFSGASSAAAGAGAAAATSGARWLVPVGNSAISACRRALAADLSSAVAGWTVKSRTSCARRKASALAPGTI